MRTDRPECLHPQNHELYELRRTGIDGVFGRADPTDVILDWRRGVEKWMMHCDTPLDIWLSFHRFLFPRIRLCPVNSLLASATYRPPTSEPSLFIPYFFFLFCWDKLTGICSIVRWTSARYCLHVEVVAIRKSQQHALLLPRTFHSPGPAQDASFHRPSWLLINIDHASFFFSCFSVL